METYKVTLGSGGVFLFKFELGRPELPISIKWDEDWEQTPMQCGEFRSYESVAEAVAQYLELEDSIEEIEDEQAP